MALTRASAAVIKTEEIVNNRNRIINGDMRIDQRNAGAAVTITGGTGSYTVDRFFVRPNSSTNSSAVRSTDAPAGFQNSLQVTRVAGQTGALTRVQTALETFNMIDLRGQVVTLSFYAKADSGYTPSSSALTVVLFAGNGTERVRSITAYDNQTTPINTNVTLTTSWQKFTITSSSLPADLSQLTVEFNAVWVGTAPSNDGFYITGVQLEVGSVATPFERRPYGTELALCQRYYEKSYRQSVAVPTNSSLNGFAVALANRTLTGSATNERSANIVFNVSKRAAPTITFYTLTNSTAGSWEDGGGNAIAMLTNGISETAFIAYNNANVATNTGLQGHWVASIEL